MLKHIHENIRAYPRSGKKTSLVNDWENDTGYWGESQQSEVLANKSDLIQMQLGNQGAAQPHEKIYPLLSLETAFLALELAQNCYVNMSISFSWKLPI